MQDAIHCNNIMQQEVPLANHPRSEHRHPQAPTDMCTQCRGREKAFITRYTSFVIGRARAPPRFILVLISGASLLHNNVCFYTMRSAN